MYTNTTGLKFSLFHPLVSCWFAIITCSHYDAFEPLNVPPEAPEDQRQLSYAGLVLLNSCISLPRGVYLSCIQFSVDFSFCNLWVWAKCLALLQIPKQMELERNLQPWTPETVLSAYETMFFLSRAEHCCLVFIFSLLTW